MFKWRRLLTTLLLAVALLWPSVGAQSRQPFLAVGATMFWAAWGYKFDRERLEKNLQYLSARGVHYVRVLGVVGPGGWSDRTVDPAWPDYDEVIAGTTDVAYKHGLRVEWSIFGSVDLAGTPKARDDLVRRFVAMARGREHKIQHWEVVNEGFQNGFSGTSGRDEARALASILRRETPNVVSITAPQDGCLIPSTLQSIVCSPTDLTWAAWWYQGSAANLITIHADRSQTGTGAEWRPVRQLWDVQFYAGIPRAFTSNEPIGAQSSVAEDTDPMRATMSAALTWANGGAGYVVHTGAGIRGGGLEDRLRGRAANIWESPNADEIFAGIKTVLGLLPPDLPNWARSNTNKNFPDYPFDVDVIGPDIVDERVLRAFCNAKGSEFICFPIRIRGPTHFQAKRPMRVDVIHPLTGATLRTVTLAVGEQLVLDVTVPALVLKGQWR